MGKIVVKSYIESCMTNAEGEKIRDLVLREQTPIILDFVGLYGMTTSFANSLFVDILEMKGIDYLKSIDVLNITSGMKEVILNRVRFEMERRNTL